MKSAAHYAELAMQEMDAAQGAYQPDHQVARAAVWARLAQAAATLEASQPPIVDAEVVDPIPIREFIEQYCSIYPVESVRDGWHEARCSFGFCPWSTTGSEPVVEEALWEHIPYAHPEAVTT